MTPADLAALRKALLVGRESFDGDGWYASAEGLTEEDDTTESIFDPAFAALNSVTLDPRPDPLSADGVIGRGMDMRQMGPQPAPDAALDCGHNNAAINAIIERLARVEEAAQAVVDSDVNHDGLLYVHIDDLRANLSARP